MTGTWSHILTILGLLVCSLAAGEEVFYDYAVVSAVEVLKDDPYREAGDAGPRCRDDGAAAGTPMRGDDLAGLAAAIGQALDEAERSRCMAGEHARITGYRVHYSYAGALYTRVLGFDPGNRIRVRVRLDAGP